ncbi:tryptophan-rich sensory protein [Arthrobacter sp. ISL-85]|uniref:TspO/MBR family protein n=1 Tax=Arthrobacter sp. ISL-85 TaxID=2819115 RepID=UPI001BE6E19E|nr:TspO/MBR family protein [Arthrobacter sp. ISL-85]MBT2568287.1 tryptophan-rich sensory protein [Arthrobacter sp. ISL-85]
MPVIPESRPAAAAGIPGTRSQCVALAGFLALSALAWVLSSVPIILNSGGWYAGSLKAPWMPPSWMFRTIWPVLYAGVAAAAWLVWRKGRLSGGALAGYVLQLLLNTAWPVTFFALYPMLGVVALWAAFAVVCALTATLAFLILRFGPVDTAAGYLVLPYFSWLVFSATLNLYSAMHN